jgi:hypothetical protein
MSYSVLYARYDTCKADFLHSLYLHYLCVRTWTKQLPNVSSITPTKAKPSLIRIYNIYELQIYSAFQRVSYFSLLVL